MPPQACANYTMGPLLVSYSLKVEPPTDLLIYISVCFGVCLLLPDAILDATFTNGGSTTGLCSTEALWNIPMVGICASW